MKFFKKIEKWNRERRKVKKIIKIEENSRLLVQNLKKALEMNKTDIPVFVISYNNGIYVENMVDQLNKFSITPIIIDNASSAEETKKILDNIDKSKRALVAYSSYNFGHLVGFIKPVYEVMPEKFAYTDPDLQLNSNLPKNFLEILYNLANKYEIFKAGFALDIEINKKMIDKKNIIKKDDPIEFYKEYSVIEWEKLFWRHKLDDKEYDVYIAPIDTTFAVYSKKNYEGYFVRGVRVAGDFTAVHLPWYPDLDLFDNNQKSEYLKENKSSTWI